MLGKEGRRPRPRVADHELPGPVRLVRARRVQDRLVEGVAVAVAGAEVVIAQVIAKSLESHR